MKAQKTATKMQTYIFNKSTNVKSVKPQLVSPEAQQRQCQSIYKE